MYSSVEDLIKIVSDLLIGTKLLKRETARELLVPEFLFNDG